MKIIVGDIHACKAELEELLDKIGFGPDDQVIALGDIFDRGPDNRGILELFSSDSRFMTLKGNHERKHILISENKCRAAVSQMITKEEFGKDYIRLLEFARNLPNYIELDKAILVHGALEPGIALENQHENILVSSISGERFLNKLGRPWYELLNINKPVIFGHKVYDEPLIFQDKVYGIDTGCCLGKRLTAMTLPDFRIYSVKAKKAYWPAAGNEFLSQHPELAKTKKAKTLGELGVDVQATYEKIVEYADELKSQTGSRKEFADEVKKRNLPSIIFRAYEGKLTLDFVKKIDISKLGEFAECQKRQGTTGQ
jgi:serine/threonine protein phosphatase 1